MLGDLTPYSAGSAYMWHTDNHAGRRPYTENNNKPFKYIKYKFLENQFLLAFAPKSPSIHPSIHYQRPTTIGQFYRAQFHTAVSGAHIRVSGKWAQLPANAQQTSSAKTANR